MTPRRALPVISAVLALLVVGPAAHADPLVDAQQRAVVLRQQVADLQSRTDAAVEEYDGAQDALGATVTARLQAEAALDRARTADRAAGAVRAARLRTLYELGGPLALYGTVLGAGSPTDALHGVHIAQQLLGVDAASATADDRSDQELTRALERAAAAAQEQVSETKRVDGLVQQVQGLLAQQQELLAGVDADVARIADQQRQEQDRAAEAAFAAELAAAQAAQAAPQAGFAVGPDLPTSQRAAVALAAARAQLGKPYVWGATGPDAFDCSGLTGWAYAAAGVRLPRTSRSQWSAGPHPSLAQLEPGDLLFWGSDPTDPSTIHHVALYIGGGSMIAAPHTGTVVQVQRVYANGYVGATRVS